jgi:hypothetical protein
MYYISKKSYFSSKKPTNLKIKIAVLNFIKKRKSDYLRRPAY